MHLPSRAVSLALASTLTLAISACAGDSTSDSGMETSTGDGDGDATASAGDGDGDGSPGDGDGAAALSYAADIQPIWNTSCVVCHVPGGLGAILDLTGDSYANVVNVASTQATDKMLIEPGNSANSYLVAKLLGTQASLGGSGVNMPSGSMLDSATIMMIEQWVDDGAAP